MERRNRPLCPRKEECHFQLTDPGGHSLTGMGTVRLVGHRRQARRQLTVSCCQSKRLKSDSGPGSPMEPTQKQPQLWFLHREHGVGRGGRVGLVKLQMSPELPFPSRHPGTLRTIPRDLVAQVWVTPESCWKDGLDQSESQRADSVSSLERAGGHGRKHSRRQGSFAVPSPAHSVTQCQSPSLGESAVG